MAIVINEWLPNPTGNDAVGEFVELYNNGNTPTSVNGWALETSTKKPKKITGTVPADGYLVLYRKQTKLVLKNTDERIALYDASGKLVDQSSFTGAAPEGKSFGRIQSGIKPPPSLPLKGEEGFQQFSWGEPTPGAENKVSLAGISIGQNLPINTAINNPTLSVGLFAVMLFGVAILLTGIIIYSIKHYEDLSYILFDGDQAAG